MQKTVDIYRKVPTILIFFLAKTYKSEQQKIDFI